MLGFRNWDSPPSVFLEHYPLGMALAEDGSTVSFTCASCHFAQLDDGRYSVGRPITSMNRTP